MINLEETLKRIEAEGTVEKTSKELKTSGLNDYYIKKAIEEGSLEKIARGKYKVVNVEKNKNRATAFNMFIKAINTSDYEKAYDYLYTNFKNQTTHEYDHNLKLYFILLKEILKESKDFSFLDDILAFSDVKRNNSYYQYFIDFNEAVLKENFDAAYKAISLFKDAEKERKGYNYVSTKLFFHLTSEIFYNKKQKENENQTSKKEKSLTAEEISFRYKEHYASLLRNIEADNYEAALEDLENALKYAYPKAQNNLRKMAAIIKKYLEIKSSKEILPELEINYTTLGNDYSRIFNIALNNNDYLTAYKNIGKCVYLNKESTTLNIYKKLLYTLIEQNKENKKNTTSKPKTLLRVKIPNSSEDKKLPNNSEKTKSSNNSEEVKPLDINIISKLIYNREYEQLKTLIESQKNTNDRLYEYISRMLQDMEEMRNSNYRREKVHTYKNDNFKIFKRFFEALNFKDYQEASNLVGECIEISEGYHSNTTELTIYSYMLEDILKLKKEVEEKRARENKLKELEQQQKSIIFKRQITEEDLTNLESITTEKLEISEDTNTIHDIYIIQMIETLRNISTYNLDKNSFEQFTYSENDVIEKFLKAISLGDYQTAYQISQEEKWRQAIQKDQHKNNLLLHKKLLQLIERNLEKSSRRGEFKETTDDVIEKPILKHLATLKTLLKKRKFVEAYNYYKENSLEEINSQLDTELQVFLAFLDQTVRKEALELNQKFKELEINGDYSEAYKSLQEYQEFIENNSLNRNLDYHKARLEVYEKEVQTPEFAEKELLFAEAKHYSQENQYQKAIELLNEYISKDNDLSAKGYLLRGRCHERQKEYEKAKSDYEKALSIIPEPNAYHRLGKIYFYRGDYQEALAYFLEYEERRPAHHKINLYALRDTYEALGEKEQSDKCKNLIKTAK